MHRPARLRDRVRSPLAGDPPRDHRGPPGSLDHDLDALASQFAAWAYERRPSQASLRGQVLAATRFRAPTRVDVPVLASEGDRLVSPYCSRRLAAHLGAPISVHPDGGHDLPLDDPHWICDQLRSSP